MRHNARALIAAVLLAGSAAFSASPTGAQSKSLVWERLDTEIVVGEDGALYITETNVIRFTQGTFTFGFREIPYFRLTDVRDVRVSERDPRSGLEVPLYVERGNDGESLLIKYYFARPAERETRTFILRYTVDGAVRYYEGGDQVWWAAVYADRSGFDVRQARATLRVPEGAVVQKAEVYGVRAEVRGVGSTVVVADALEVIPNGVTMELRVQFTHGVVRGAPPPWQREFDARREFEETVQPVLDLLVLLASLLLALGGPALAAVIYVTRGRDPNVGLVAEYLTAPPDIPPGLGGALYDERADVQDLVATIVDLARRGVLQLREEAPNRWSIVRGEAFETASLEPFERLLIVRLGLDKQTSRSLESLHQKFYVYLPELQSVIYDALVQRGYYTRSPEVTRNRYRTLAGALFLLAVLAFFGAIMLAEWVNFAICPAVGLLIAGIAFAIIAPHMPVRTRAGAEMRMRIVAFRRYLQNLERYLDVKTATAVFERYLPWAIALGLQRSWMRKFSATPTPAPPWYVPYEPPPLRRFPTFAGGSTGGRLASPAAEKPDIGGAATQAPSLEQMERTLGRSLSAFERNLSSMFDTLAHNLTSTPPTSSSRSGGWSGGGSRGGGFSGGGRGGFG